MKASFLILRASTWSELKINFYNGFVSPWQKLDFSQPTKSTSSPLWCVKWLLHIVTEKETCPKKCTLKSMAEQKISGNMDKYVSWWEAALELSLGNRINLRYDYWKNFNKSFGIVRVKALYFALLGYNENAIECQLITCFLKSETPKFCQYSLHINVQIH